MLQEQNSINNATSSILSKRAVQTRNGGSFKGWNTIKEGNPSDVSKVLKLASFDDGSILHNSEFKLSKDFYSPTGGTWNTTPITITSEPVYQISNPSFVSDQIVRLIF